MLKIMLAQSTKAYSLKLYVFCFSEFGIFGGKMISQSSRQILFLVL